MIHAHLFPTFYWIAICKPKCKKMIYSEHNTINLRMGKSILKNIEHFIYGRYFSIICVGHGVKDALNRWLPEYRDKYVTIYNGINLERFAEALPIDRASFNIPEKAVIGVMVARLDDQKDQQTIINAAAKIGGLHILLAGDGKNRDTLHLLSQQLKVEHRIHFLGYRGDIPSLLKLSDVYLHSSHHEGMSLAIVEALAAGVPVIASEVDGITEIIRHGKSGLLFREGDAQDLALKITSVLENADLRNALQMGAFQRANDFSITTTVNRIISLYDS